MTPIGRRTDSPNARCSCSMPMASFAGAICRTWERTPARMVYSRRSRSCHSPRRPVDPPHLLDTSPGATIDAPPPPPELGRLNDRAVRAVAADLGLGSGSVDRQLHHPHDAVVA